MTRAAPAPSNPGNVRSIKKGQAAPFDGVIYDIQAHALLVSKTKALQAKLQLELDFLKQRLTLDCESKTRALKVDLETAAKKLDLEAQARKQQKDFLLGQVSDATKVPWYREPMFNFTIGFLVCALITGLSVYAWRAVSK